MPPHQQSILVTESTMPRVKAVVDPKELRAQLKEAKAAVAAAKKIVTEKQSAAMDDPAVFKDYRTSVSEHIAAMKTMHVVLQKLSAVAE